MQTQNPGWWCEHPQYALSRATATPRRHWRQRVGRAAPCPSAPQLPPRHAGAGHANQVRARARARGGSGPGAPFATSKVVGEAGRGCPLPPPLCQACLVPTPPVPLPRRRGPQDPYLSLGDGVPLPARAINTAAALVEGARGGRRLFPIRIEAADFSQMRSLGA